MIAERRKGSFPETGQSGANAHPEPVVEIAHVEEILRRPEAFLDEKRRLTLTIEHCSLLAAPFLLFHFKKLGFSRCRVTRRGNGLSLFALR